MENNFTKIVIDLRYIHHMVYINVNLKQFVVIALAILHAILLF